MLAWAGWDDGKQGGVGWRCGIEAIEVRGWEYFWRVCDRVEKLKRYVSLPPNGRVFRLFRVRRPKPGLF